jgi:TadE-like protein
MTSRTGWLNQRGQAAVELALVLPIFLLIVVGMLEFARAWDLHQAITDAVREGARRALIRDEIAIPIDSVYAPMWRNLEQAGYKATYASMGVCDAPNTSCASTYPFPGQPSKWKAPGEKVTITMSVPYRLFVLGNRAIIMKSYLTVRNE